MTSPRVSVIIPTFNGSALLGESIASVLAQTYQDFELIVVDDGSTDNTSGVVASFATKQIRYIHQVNRGVGAARNTGAKAANGELLVFLDHDDLLLPDCLQMRTAFFDEHPRV